MRRVRPERLALLHRLPGRVRVQAGVQSEAVACRLEEELGRVGGVRSVRANPRTGNVLVCFDPEWIGEEQLLTELDGVRSRLAETADGESDEATGGPGLDRSALLRAGVRGVLGHALVDAVFYGVVLAEPFGLPLAGLGALHLGADAVAWSVALAPLLGMAADTRSEPDGSGAA